MKMELHITPEGYSRLMALVVTLDRDEGCHEDYRKIANHLKGELNIDGYQPDVPEHVANIPGYEPPDYSLVRYLTIHANEYLRNGRMSQEDAIDATRIYRWLCRGKRTEAEYQAWLDAQEKDVRAAVHQHPGEAEEAKRKKAGYSGHHSVWD